MKRMLTALLALLTLAAFVACGGPAASGEATSAQDQGVESTPLMQTAVEPLHQFVGSFEQDGYFTVDLLQLLYSDNTFTIYQARLGSGEEYKFEYYGVWSENEDGSFTIDVQEKLPMGETGPAGVEAFEFRYITSGVAGAASYTLNFDMFGYDRTAIMTQTAAVTEEPEAWLQARYEGEGTGVATSSIEDYYDTRAEQYAKIYAERPEGEIILYGASNFDYWLTVEEDIPEYPIQNKGIGGTGDEELVKYLPALIYDCAPSIVYYMSNSNDWTSGKTVEEIWSLKQEIFTDLAQNCPETVFVILSTTPNPLRYFADTYHEGMVELNGLIEAYCAEHSSFVYLDLVTPLTNTEGTANEEIWGDDDLHFNEEGYALLANILRESIESICGEYGITFN